MLKRRIIPCLDVAHGQVVKGVVFQNHDVVGEILTLAKEYSDAGADELVFYDILASCERRVVDPGWIARISALINIPFCVAGGIRSVAEAEVIFAHGADKISINSPALANPELITQLATRFGRQAVVVGIDSFKSEGLYRVRQYTGVQHLTRDTDRQTLEWAREVIDRGAGELVINCMNLDGTRQGYDLEQLALLADAVDVPVIASGGAGTTQHFIDVFRETRVSGALAASVFHKKAMTIPTLKRDLLQANIGVRP